MFKTVLVPKRKCRPGWMEYPAKAVLMVGDVKQMYTDLKKVGVQVG